MAKTQTKLKENPCIVTSKMLSLMQYQVKKFALQNAIFSRSSISGQHNSKKQSRGMDYHESRLYQAGDDIRNIDWKVTAKTGDAYTKLYNEEREKPTYILLDTNLNMKFGTKQQFKSTAAAKIAAFIAWSTVRYGDRVGLICFGANGLHASKALSGKRGMSQLISNIVSAYNTKETQIIPLDSVLKKARSVITPGSTLVIISDFSRLGDKSNRHLVQLKKHSDILAISVNDPFELSPPKTGLFGVWSDQKSVIFNAKEKQIYQKFLAIKQQFIHGLQSHFKDNHIPVIPIKTSDHLTEVLSHAYQNPEITYKKWLEEMNHG